MEPPSSWSESLLDAERRQPQLALNNLTLLRGLPPIWGADINLPSGPPLLLDGRRDPREIWKRLPTAANTVLRDAVHSNERHLADQGFTWVVFQEPGEPVEWVHLSGKPIVGEIVDGTAIEQARAINRTPPDRAP